ncbi:MAG: hypothetical protein AAB421_01025 [Patescibacteria group bacterium]
MMKSFWDWYERTYTLNLSIALGLFLLQIVHLIWLFGAVVWTNAFGAPLFELTGIWQTIIVFVDYTEIPALLSVSLIYIHELRSGWRPKTALYLGLLLVQLLHMFWITDEFVLDVFIASGHGTVLPAWLAWVAILIDYLEVPVIFDATRRLMVALKEKKGLAGVKDALKEDE